MVTAVKKRTRSRKKCRHLMRESCVYGGKDGDKSIDPWVKKVDSLDEESHDLRCPCPDQIKSVADSQPVAVFEEETEEG